MLARILATILGLVLITTTLQVSTAFAQQTTELSTRTVLSKSDWNAQFKLFYQQELGDTQPCTRQLLGEFKVCSRVLKNEGNAPYILHANNPKAVVVLFHGLSDSPFFVRSIAEHLQRQNFTVVAPLTPGHGKREADSDMQDPLLKQRWHQHVDEIMTWAQLAGPDVFSGGFSTGGALATYYILDHPEATKGLLLFSGALQLSDNAESMGKIWGMKWISKIVDGEYQTQGANPFKYPTIAGYSGLVLVDVIFEIREKIAKLKAQEKAIQLPIFAAHSLSDRTTLYAGVEALVNSFDGEHSVFEIDQSYDLCHADVPISSVQLIAMSFDKSKVKEHEKCAVPQANPLHKQMLDMLDYYLSQNL